MFAEWLTAALAHAGMNQSELARRLVSEWKPGFDRSIINKVSKERRRLQADELMAISRITGYPPPKQGDENESEDANTIPLVGFVGAGAVLVNFDVSGTYERVAMVENAGDDTVAVEVRGDSLGDMFDRWLAYYDRVDSAPTSAMYGRLCVIGLLDGRVMVKKLAKGGLPDRYHLTSNFDPPIYDAEVEWAALVKCMRPRYV